MSNKIGWKSLAMGIALLAGIAGVILSLNTMRSDPPASSYDELSGEPLGI